MPFLTFFFRRILIYRQLAELASMDCITLEDEESEWKHSGRMVTDSAEWGRHLD